MIMPLLFIVNPVHFMVFFPAKVRIPALLLSVLFLCLPAYASTLHGDRLPGGLSSPEAYADFAEDWAELGATILGGCCEVSPAHIAELARRFTG